MFKNKVGAKQIMPNFRKCQNYIAYFTSIAIFAVTKQSKK